MSKRSAAPKPKPAAPAPPQKAKAKTTSPPTGSRLWLFRIVAATVVPLVFFGILELGLRVSGFGYTPGFLLSDMLGGKPVLHDNPDFTQRFFAPHLVRTPHSFTTAADKPAGVFRIVVLGESAAMGDPAPAFGFSRILQVMLEVLYPDRRFEVLNAGITSINSHAVREIAQDCLRLQPDLYVVYMGNNEVVGPYGVGTVFQPLVGSMGVIRTQLAVKKLRIGQALDRFGRWVGTNKSAPAHWEGMTMFLGHEVRATDPGLQVVYTHFRRNLEDILDTAERAKVPVALATIGVNLRDNPPFGSKHRADLSAADETRWQAELDAGIAAEDAHRFGDALHSYTRAAAIDGQSAALAYRQGRCLYATGRYADAAAAFERARDLDTLRFRADGPINDAIREIARRRPSVRFVDVEEAFRKESPHGITGEELLYEHVHMTFEGNYVIARELMAGLLPILPNAARPLPSVEECAKRLGFTPWQRIKILHDVLERFLRPPFQGQIGEAERNARMTARLAALGDAASPERLPAMIAEVSAQAEHATGWELHENLAEMLEAANHPQEAIAEWHRVLDDVPHYMEAHANLAKLLFRAGRTDASLAEFEKARDLRPYLAESYNNIGAVYAGQRKWLEAEAAYRRALSIDSSSRDALINLAMAYNEQKRVEEARGFYQKAAEQPSFTAESHYQLAMCAQALDLAAEAKDHALAALALEPHHQGAYDLLMEAYRKMGQPGEAVAFLQKLLTQDPTRVDARLTLGAIAEAQGRPDDAAIEYEKARAPQRDPRPYLALAQLRRRQSRGKEAAQILKEGVKVFPDSEELWQRLATMNMETDPAQAIADYRHIHERWPNDWVSVANLAWILATAPDERLRDGAQALDLAQQAVQMTGEREPQILNTVAAALAQQGRFPEAVAAAKHAHEVAVAAGRQDLAKHIQDLTGLYEKGQRYPSGPGRH